MTTGLLDIVGAAWRGGPSLPPFLFTSMGLAIVLVGAYRAYSKVADERDRLIAAGKPAPLDLSVTTTTAFIARGLPHDFVPALKMSVLMLEVTIINRGDENVSLSLAGRVTHPKFDRPFSFTSGGVPKTFLPDNRIEDSQLHVVSKGPAVKGDLVLSLDNPAAEYLVADDASTVELVLTDEFTDQVKTVPIDVFTEELE